MDMKLELVAVPVTDVDRALDFYVKAGFVLDRTYEGHLCTMAILLEGGSIT